MVSQTLSASVFRFTRMKGFVRQKDARENDATDFQMHASNYYMVPCTSVLE